MDYWLKLCSGGWCPDYYGKEEPKPEVLELKADELVSIPLHHPDLQRLFRYHYKRPPRIGQFQLRVAHRIEKRRA